MTLLAKRANIVTLVTTVKVDMKTVRLLILRLALVAQQDTPLTKEVLNVKLVERERSVMIAKIAHWGLHETEMTMMRRNADNVHWGKQRR